MSNADKCLQHKVEWCLDCMPVEPKQASSGNSDLLCADCGAEIGKDSGPKDGWQLEDGRTVCHSCCAADTRKIASAVVNLHTYLNCVANEQCQINIETKH